ncbi:MAG: hypothetical protein HYZ53_03355 [Planctomycetes bacterium]|nr:hypothetical protein [Planctomycetota bacterium]
MQSETTWIAYVSLAIVAGLLFLGWAASPTNFASAPPLPPPPPAPPPEKAPANDHGGVRVETREFDFEVVFHHDRLALWTYDKGGKHVASRDLQATAEFDFTEPERGEPGEVDRRAGGEPEAKPRGPIKVELVRLDTAEGAWLQGDVDLQRIAEGEAIARLRVSGLPGKEERTVELSQPFRIARACKYVCKVCETFADRPGTCRRCGARLERHRTFYGCLRHAAVASDRKGDACWKCGERLVELAEEPDPLLPGKEQRRPDRPE